MLLGLLGWVNKWPLSGIPRDCPYIAHPSQRRLFRERLSPGPPTSSLYPLFLLFFQSHGLHLITWDRWALDHQGHIILGDSFGGIWSETEVLPLSLFRWGGGRLWKSNSWSQQGLWELYNSLNSWLIWSLPISIRGAGNWITYIQAALMENGRPPDPICPRDSFLSV